jgi:hypothetical protein
LNGLEIPFGNQVKYLDMISCNIITWSPYTEVIADNAFGVFTAVHYLFSNKRLINHMKLTLHKAFITPILSYACSAWEFSADTHLLKLLRLHLRLCL